MRRLTRVGLSGHLLVREHGAVEVRAFPALGGLRIQGQVQPGTGGGPLPAEMGGRQTITRCCT